MEKAIHNIIQENSMEYSGYILLNRCIPDLRDSCKPVVRRIIYTMHKEKAIRFVKSANISGSVMKIHPHGDCYDTMVGMVQQDKELLPWLIGKGNFSQYTSRDLQPGASRYTEVKLGDFTIDTLKDLNQKTVNYTPSYDGKIMIPEVLPVKYPMILSYAQSGIGMGMASSIPSFNMKEVVVAIENYVNTGNKTNLIPDFATGGYILNNSNVISNINNNGLGSVILRGKCTIEGNTISVTEIPYKTTREIIIEKIIDLIKEGKLKEITDIKDLTGLNGMLIEITCKKNVNMDMLLNKLYKLTPLESSYSSNMNVLCDGLPKVMGVWGIIDKWLEWRKDCIIRTYSQDIVDLKAKLHLYNGLIKIIDHIDEIISIIRNSQEEDIIYNLCSKFNIDEIQAEYIADIKLRNLNKEYINKTIRDKEDLEDKIEQLSSIINSNEELLQIIIKEMKDIAKKYSKPRKTEILHESEIATTITKQDLVEDYNCRILYTSEGYIKKHLKQSDSHKLKENDTILGDITSTNKSTLLIFTNKANRYRLPVHELETVTPSSYGIYIKNIIDLEEDEQIIKIVSIEKEIGNMCFVFDNGKIAKIGIKSYMSANKKLQNCYNTESNLIAIEYIENDVDVLMVSSEGKALIVNTDRFAAKGSRNSQGNVAIKLDDNLTCIGATISITQDNNFKITTAKGKKIMFMLSDVAPTNKPNEERTLFTYLQGRNGNTGNFVVNTRVSSDSVTEYKTI